MNDRSRKGQGALRPLYTPAERARRDASVWTIVQGVMAPLQFLVFLVSLGLVLRFLLTGSGQQAATLSVLVKTLTLFAIMTTGSIWEKVVFGRWLFADAFFWEDVFSMLVIALHAAYVIGLWVGYNAHALMFVALAAYASYVVNATQFLIKLRAARRQTPVADMPGSDMPGSDMPASDMGALRFEGSR